MPERAFLFDLPPDEIAEVRAEAEAEADVTMDRVVPHQRVREWLTRLVTGEKIPPPST